MNFIVKLSTVTFWGKGKFYGDFLGKLENKAFEGTFDKKKRGRKTSTVTFWGANTRLNSTGLGFKGGFLGKKLKVKCVKGDVLGNSLKSKVAFWGTLKFQRFQRVQCEKPDSKGDVLGKIRSCRSKVTFF